MNKYKNLTPEEREELESNYLINSWSYSKITAFARNEKAFEASYIYGLYGKKSASTVAGNAYHSALENYFFNKKNGVQLDLVELQAVAFSYIEQVPANYWKLQKTTPTIEECQIKTIKMVNGLLENFMQEKAVYEDFIKDIIDVEVSGDEYVTVNGVDIALPVHFKIDLVFRTQDDKIIIADHKSKTSYTSEEEAQLAIGVQAMTYVLAYEEMTGLEVSEVWFIENKASKNKDNSSQLQPIKLTLTSGTRRMFEALIYEPLRRMLEAVSNPDYVYLINDSDNFVDKAELYEFWYRTMIAEVDDFNVDPTKKDLVAKRLKKIRDSSLEMIPPEVIKAFKEKADTFITFDLSNKNMTHQQKIEHALRSFNIIGQVAHEFIGYSSNTYLLQVSAGVSVKSVYSKRLDIANALDVANVRISNELVVHEGKSYLGIDFSKKREADLIFEPADLHEMKIPIGKDNFGNVIVWDFENHSTPHALICGATGSGKSVSIASTIEYAKLAGIDEIYIFDPKREFRRFHNQRDTFVYNDIEEIEEQMFLLVREMNEMVKNGKRKMTLVVFDEFADAVGAARRGKELNGAKSLEENLKALLQKGRSIGYRILAATQRASVKVITGDAKVNFPVQICFKVPKEVDSKVVIDEVGAESLSGRGDGLIKSPEYGGVVRFQAYYKPDAAHVTKKKIIEEAIIIEED